MKKFGFLIFAGALILGLVVSTLFSLGRVSDNFFNFSFNFKGEKGSGVMASEVRDARGFSAIDVGGVFQVEVTAQKDFELEVEADDNLLQYIKTEVHGNTLQISTDKRLSPSGPIRIRISAPNIDEMEVSGAANVTVNELKNASLTVDASGASKIKLNGETSKLAVDVSGATNVNADNLKSETAVVEASGASHVDVHATGTLKANASGASKIVYAGSPASVQKTDSGASKITAK